MDELRRRREQREIRAEHDRRREARGEPKFAPQPGHRAKTYDLDTERRKRRGET